MLIGNKNIILMFGFQSLPTNPKDSRINRLKFLQDFTKNKKKDVGTLIIQTLNITVGNNLSLISIGYGIVPLKTFNIIKLFKIRRLRICSSILIIFLILL